MTASRIFALLICASSTAGMPGCAARGSVLPPPPTDDDTTPVSGGATVAEPTRATGGQSIAFRGSDGMQQPLPPADEEDEVDPQSGREARGDRFVFEAEDELQRLGFEVGRVDGFIDPTTRFAIQEFQRRNRIPVTGEIDPTTRTLLVP